MKMKIKIYLFIAVTGLLSVASMFIGTAAALVFFGFAQAIKVFFASLLVLIFCMIVDELTIKSLK